MLNTLMRVPQLSVAALADVRREERVLTGAIEKAGLLQRLAVTPAVHLPGSLRRIYDIDRIIVSESSNRHPFGTQKRKYIFNAVYGDDVDDADVPDAGE